MKPTTKPERYLGPRAEQQAARDAAAKTERLARKAEAKKASPPRRIKARTPQRAKDEATYRKEASQWLRHYHFCEWEGCTKKPTEVHHRNGRRGRLLLWKNGWFALCQNHHQHVHNHPDEARRRGLLCQPGQWNDQSIIE